VAARLEHPLTPRLLLVALAGPRDVVDGAGALEAALGRRVVIDVEGATSLASRLPAVLEPERLEERRRLCLVGAVGAHAGEAVQRMLGRDLRM
jgi:hypothetical protein